MTDQELIEKHGKLFAQYTRYAHNVRVIYQKANEKIIDGDLKNLWISGKAGSGKTSSVYNNINPDLLFRKQLNKWWDGYISQPYVLLDDWDPTHA